MRLLISPDKFKGSLTAVQASDAVVRGLRRIFGEKHECIVCPIADGGEGTTEALVAALGAQWITVTVMDAIGRSVEARYGLTGDGTAVMEMSKASGLAMVSDEPLEPERASTFGTGQMMLDAIQRGAKKLIIGIGGSATNDGGIGMAQALGYRFLDVKGFEVHDVPQHFDVVQGIARTELAMPEVLVACDVDNPLLGEQGATRIYGAQKGVIDFEFLEHRLSWLNELVTRDLGVAHAEEPGAGAAGGLGFGLMAFCGARLVNGFDLIAEVLELKSRIEHCDLVITGEGRLDAQTLNGKGPAGVAEMARKHGKSVIAIAGAVEDSAAVRALFDHAFAIKPASMPLAEAMSRGAELIEETVVRNADVFTEALSKSSIKHQESSIQRS
jgi:glycerate kinase